MLILILTISIILLYLIVERVRLNLWLNSIPLRISVTGTRGKSSVTRLIASMLREHGMKVLAKTTGSEASLILPDGVETEINRRGFPSILEQKKLIKHATDLKVDCIVSEIMSIHPENHFVESQQMVKPQIVVLTNVRHDHTDAMGTTLDQIASVFALDLPAKATVFIPETENYAILSATVEQKNGQLIRVASETSDSLKASGFVPMKNEFTENIDLTFAVGKYLNIDDSTIARGIEKARHDIGHLQIWKFQVDKNKKTCYLVNGFAANDPMSTLKVISKIKAERSLSAPIIALLTLRPDRAERTMQWIQFLSSDAGKIFSQLFIQGRHAAIVTRKLKRGFVVKDHAPQKIMEIIFDQAADHSVIMGVGNIVGMGKAMVDYWKSIGVEYGV